MASGIDNPVLLDDREGSSRLIRYPPLDSTGQLCRLESGDAAFVGNGPAGPLIVGIEVKSIFDLISSMNTGRLQATQLPALISTYDSPWLLYYGTYRPGRDGKLEVRKGDGWRGYKLGSRVVPYGYVEAFLFDVTAIGVKVKHVFDEREAASWIGVLHRWWSKEWREHKGLHAFDRSKELSLMPNVDEATHLRARIASQLPGVGFDRAMNAARHFDSIEAMMRAGIAEWARVPGIGKVIARAVVDAIDWRNSE